MVEPEQMPEIAEALLRMGWEVDAVRGPLGESNLRVEEQDWRLCLGRHSRQNFPGRQAVSTNPKARRDRKKRAGWNLTGLLWLAAYR